MSLSRQLDFYMGIPLHYLLSCFQKKRFHEQEKEPKKILLIKLAALGDTILLIPVLKRFRERHPNATIHWLVSPINQGIARFVPYVDNVILWNRSVGWALVKLIGYLRAQKYDAIVDLEQWSRGSALIAAMSGAPVRLGFESPGQYRTSLFTGTFKKQFVDHEQKDFHGLLSMLGPLDETGPLELPNGFLNRAELDDFRRELNFKKGLKVVIHPGCGADGLPREWPLADYGVLAHWLIKKYDAQIFLTSGPEESKKTADLAKLLKGGAADLGGRLKLPGLAALLKEVDLVISGNTGIMHMAAALRRKQVTLHGPTNPLIWGPLNPDAQIIKTTCSQCPTLKLGFEYHVTDQSCMKKIDIEAVKQAVSFLLEGSTR